MKKMKRTFVLTLLSLVLSATCSLKLSAQQSDWYLPKCVHFCNLVLSGGENSSDVMRQYEHVNNITHPDGYGFAECYTHAARITVDGRILGLGKGISNTVVVNQRTDSSNSCQVVTTYYSAANATKFRNQVLELGFTKKHKDREGVHYYEPEYGMEVVESFDTMGKYKLYMFTIRRAQ